MGELVDRIAALGKPLYIAENDYPSAPVAQTFPPISDFPYSNSGQAAYVSSQLRWASNNPNIIGWTWFYPEWYPGISNGLGLKIIGDRLRTLYDGRASLDVHLGLLGGRVTILIPRLAVTEAGA